MRLTAARDNIGAIGKWPQAQIKAEGASVPAPIEGWDALSPKAAMSPKRAVRLRNWFPQPGYVELRKGHVVHSDTGSGMPVDTVAAYQGVSSRELYAWSGSDIYDVTTGPTGSSVVSGLNSSRSQFINFATTGGNFLYTVNGVDDPQIYNGTVWSTPVITGITASDIIGINSHKNRLWFTLTNSSDAAYLPVDSIQGAAVRFPLGGLWNQGGYLMAMGTWSVDGGNGPDDYAVFVSSRGQVAIYSGTNPASAATWQLVGVFDMGAPIGRRCLTKVGADIAIICVDGVVPLSRAMIFERAAAQKVSLTQNIQPEMNQAATQYMNNFGWQLISYPRGTRAILNVPQIENNTQVQFVMNTINGAWCLFDGMNANSWELLNDRLYFGGNDGIVYLADEGGCDPVNILRADMMTAYNYYGERGREKRWMMCRPLLNTDQSVSPGLAFNTDFQDTAGISVSQTTPLGSALWDVALWDDGLWAPGVVTVSSWTSVTGLGYCASIRMVVDIPNTSVNDITLQVVSFDLTLEKGGFI
jgi:hypothetical protein